MITLVYYDQRDYVQKTGIVSKISFEEEYIQLVKTKIRFKSIVDIQSEEMDIYEY